MKFAAYMFCVSTVNLVTKCVNNEFFSRDCFLLVHPIDKKSMETDLTLTMPRRPKSAFSCWNIISQLTRKTSWVIYRAAFVEHCS